MRSMHANLPVPSSLKIEELILTLGTNKLLSVGPEPTIVGHWTHQNSSFSTDDANCKGKFWILSLKGKRIKAQRVQYKEFVESKLKIRLQWIGQCSQWPKDGKKARNYKERTSFSFSSSASPRRVVLEYTFLRLEYDYSS